MLAFLTEVSDGASLSWYWYVIGFGGQIAFGSRFYVQWLASERARRSVVPSVFWHLSLLGSLLLLSYAIRLGDPVFITGQATGFLVYSRNLYFIRISGEETVVPPSKRQPRPEEMERAEPEERDNLA